MLIKQYDNVTLSIVWYPMLIQWYDNVTLSTAWHPMLIKWYNNVTLSTAPISVEINFAILPPAWSPASWKSNNPQDTVMHSYMFPYCHTYKNVTCYVINDFSHSHVVLIGSNCTPTVQLHLWPYGPAQLELSAPLFSSVGCYRTVLVSLPCLSIKRNNIWRLKTKNKNLKQSWLLTFWKKIF